jgi:DHA2 family multidrug resistance protein
MAVLDIQITNSSLKDIQGALGATLDEGTWISTSYLVAEIIVIPLTGWLSQVFSVRRYLVLNAGLFVLFSMCCAWSWDLTSMIAFRALQGITGGALIPMAMTVILTELPPEKRSIGMALFSITATFAPTIGPTLGGWLTDNYGWQYIFYINLIPGLFLLAAVWTSLAKEPFRWDLLKRGDWLGILTMGIGLGSLQIVLEEGNRKDWFGSEMIVLFSILAAVFLVLFLWRQLTAAHPLLNLKLLKKWNFSMSAVVNVILGVGLYGSVFLLPTYLAQVQGYNALQIGQAMIWVGLPQLFIIPFVPFLMKKVDARILIACGVLLFAVSCWLNVWLTADTGMDQLVIPQLVRALGQPLIFIPLSSVAMAGIVGAEAAGASAMFNMMRNLGGSLGIAAIATLLTRREQFHFLRLGESVSLLSSATQQRIDQLTQLFISRGSDIVTAQQQAIAALSNMLHKQSLIMAYGDCFYVMALLLLSGILAVLLLRKAAPSTNAAVH